MLGESKGPIINVNLKKHPREIQHPITDVKMEFLPKIANAFNLKTFLQKNKKKHHFRCVTGTGFASDFHKCFLQTTKELYHSFLEWWLLLPSRDFTCSKSTIETLKKH